MELSAELIGRDGCSRPFRVSCVRTLRGLQGGVQRLQEEVSAELSRLVEQEQEQGAGAEHSPDNEEEDGEDDDDDNSSKNGALVSSPPAKRIKTKQN